MGNVLKAIPGGGGELDDIDKEEFSNECLISHWRSKASLWLSETREYFLENSPKTLKNNKRVAADCVFPIDRILSQLVSVAPASCLGILLFFSSSGQVYYHQMGSTLQYRVKNGVRSEVDDPWVSKQTILKMMIADDLLVSTCFPVKN